jgi:hypothetical protein
VFARSGGRPQGPLPRCGVMLGVKACRFSCPKLNARLLYLTVSSTALLGCLPETSNATKLQVLRPILAAICSGLSSALPGRYFFQNVQMLLPMNPAASAPLPENFHCYQAKVRSLPEKRSLRMFSLDLGELFSSDTMTRRKWRANSFGEGQLLYAGSSNLP